MDNFLGQSNSPQIQPDSRKALAEGLRQKGLADLTSEFAQLLDNMTEETYDSDVIDAYLDALDERDELPMPEPMDPEVAYQNLKKRARDLFPKEDNIEKPQAYTRRRPRHSAWRRYAMAAATICLMFTLMIGAQAAGFDVFGNLAQWTDEVFSFVLPASQKSESEYYSAFQEVLREHELPEELAPAWYPEDFQTDGPIYDEGNPFCDSVSMYFTHEDRREFTVSVSCFFLSEDVENGIYEKDVTSVELYASGKRTFYIFSNNSTITATWADGLLSVRINGAISIEEAKKIIDSIGG